MFRSTEKNQHPSRPPRAWSLRVVSGLFRGIGPLAPKPMARWANWLWRRTKRYPRSASEQRLLDKAERRQLDTDSGPVAVMGWGEGPAVLLVHGWNGRGTQMGSFIGPLLRAGYRVVAVDAPGHGDSSGRQCSVLAAAAALQAVAREMGPFHAAITHSFGCACLLVAVSRGLELRRAVCIGPPNRLEWLAERFADALTLPPSVRKAMLAQLEARYGADIWEQVGADTLAAKLPFPGLIIHDRQDAQVPWQLAAEIAAAWPQGELVLTEGLGHNRILYHRDTIRRVVAFVSAQPAAAAP